MSGKFLADEFLYPMLLGVGGFLADRFLYLSLIGGDFLSFWSSGGNVSVFISITWVLGLFFVIIVFI